MGLKQTVYSVMIVSAADSFTKSVKALLSPREFSPVVTVKGVNEAKRMLNQRAFDFVIINAPLMGESGTKFASTLSASSHSVVLICTAADSFAAVYEQVTPFGVFTLQKPVSNQSLMTALLWMIAARERLKQSENKEVTLEKKMQDIRNINRAKWMLIEHEQYSEEQAHKWIEKQAMDRCVGKIVIALEIIQKYG